jgi:hypothetical protein
VDSHLILQPFYAILQFYGRGDPHFPVSFATSAQRLGRRPKLNIKGHAKAIDLEGTIHRTNVWGSMTPNLPGERNKVEKKLITYCYKRVFKYHTGKSKAIKLRGVRYDCPGDQILENQFIRVDEYLID